jgi:hypothetical protein
VTPRVIVFVRASRRQGYGWQHAQYAVRVGEGCVRAVDRICESLTEIEFRV